MDPPDRRRPALRPNAGRFSDAPGRAHAPRILVLTAALGAGHARAGQAIATAIRARRPDCTIRTLDFWSLMDEAVAASLQGAYLRLVRQRPALYDRIYRLDQRTWRAILGGAPLPAPLLEGLAVLAEVTRTTLDASATRATHSFDRLMLRCFCGAWDSATRLLPGAGSLLRLAIIRSGWTILARRLDALVHRHAPDAIVCTQMTPAALLAVGGARRRAAVPALGVVTDFGVHDFWLQPGVDSYCLPHPEIALRAGRRESRALATGMPLMPAFEHPPMQAEARTRLGLAPAVPVVLVTGGGLGLGVGGLVRALLASPAQLQVLAVTGNDATAGLQLVRARHERLRVWTWTEDMALLMRAADVIVGKPGGMTVAEALACGRPLFATHSLRAQEDFNLRFLQRHAVGDLIPAHELVAHVEAFMAAPDRLREIQGRAWDLGMRQGAARIAALALELASARACRQAAAQA